MKTLRVAAGGGDLDTQQSRVSIHEHSYKPKQTCDLQMTRDQSTQQLLNIFVCTSTSTWQKCKEQHRSNHVLSKDLSYTTHFNIRVLLGLYLEEEFSAFFHDLLDLQETSRIHEEELVAHRHAEAARVAESQNLLEALGLHSRREFHNSWAHFIAARASTIAAKKVPEVRATGSQNCSMSLKENQISLSFNYTFHRSSQ